MTSRRNNSKGANIDLHRLFAEGAFKNVYKGTYTDGPREGQELYVKFSNLEVYMKHHILITRLQ